MLKYFVLNVTLTKAPNRISRHYSDFQVDLEVNNKSNNLKLFFYLFTTKTFEVACIQLRL